MPSNQNHIVAVDDDEDDLLFLTQALREVLPGGQVQTYIDAESFLQDLDGFTHIPSLFIFDLNLPGTNGLALIRLVRRSKINPAVPVIIVSGAIDPISHIDVFEQGGNGVYLKPSSWKDWRSLASQLANRFGLF